MGDREVRWLYREVAELVRREVAPASVAERPRDHYGEPVPLVRSPLRALAVFAVLGATLIVRLRLETFVVLCVRGGQAAIEELFIEGRPVSEYLSDREA